MAQTKKFRKLRSADFHVDETDTAEANKIIQENRLKLNCVEQMQAVKPLEENVQIFEEKLETIKYNIRPDLDYEQNILYVFDLDHTIWTTNKDVDNNSNFMKVEVVKFLTLHSVLERLVQDRRECMALTSRHPLCFDQLAKLLKGLIPPNKIRCRNVLLEYGVCKSSPPAWSEEMNMFLREAYLEKINFLNDLVDPERGYPYKHVFYFDDQADFFIKHQKGMSDYFENHNYKSKYNEEVPKMLDSNVIVLFPPEIHVKRKQL
jgi:hypothetical protein